MDFKRDENDAEFENFKIYKGLINNTLHSISIIRLKFIVIL